MCNLIIIGILIISFIVIFYLNGKTYERFANQYSLLSRDEPEWFHFELTKHPRVSTVPDPTYNWMKNHYWDNYDKLLYKMGIESKAVKVPKH